MTRPATTPTSNPFQFSLAWLLLYLSVMGIVVAALVYGRSQALAAYGSDAAQTEWDDWRADAKKMTADAGPVKRREPKSAQPPALVLMRDHFAACVGLALVLSSVLFGTFMVFIRGALAANPSPPAPLPQGERGESRSPTPSATGSGKESTPSSGPDGVGGLP